MDLARLESGLSLARVQQNVPRDYDSLFAAIGKVSDLPPALFKSNSWSESKFEATARPKPTSWNPHPQATGFGQITSDVLATFNKHMKTNYTEDKDMTDPVKNLQVQAYLFSLAVNSLKSNTHLKEDWSDPRWVGLVLLAYGAGYSMTQGVPLIVKIMEVHGVPDEKITPLTVTQVAGTAFPRSKIYVAPEKRDADGWGPYMSDPALLANVTEKVADYFRFKDEGLIIPPTETEVLPVTVVDSPKDSFLAAASAVATIAMLVYVWWDHRSTAKKLA